MAKMWSFSNFLNEKPIMYTYNIKPYFWNPPLTLKVHVHVILTCKHANPLNLPIIVKKSKATGRSVNVFTSMSSMVKTISLNGFYIHDVYARDSAFF